VHVGVQMGAELVQSIVQLFPSTRECDLLLAYEAPVLGDAETSPAAVRRRQTCPALPCPAAGLPPACRRPAAGLPSCSSQPIPYTNLQWAVLSARQAAFVRSA
jgi:hypothetical protein